MFTPHDVPPVFLSRKLKHVVKTVQLGPMVAMMVIVPHVLVIVHDAPVRMRANVKGTAWWHCQTVLVVPRRAHWASTLLLIDVHLAAACANVRLGALDRQQTNV
jgi:hypothetical protein